MKKNLPLAAAIGLLAFAWAEVALNGTFHWFASSSMTPSSFHVIAPVGFVTWALFFTTGADQGAVVKGIASSAVGAIAGYLVITLGPKLSGAPNFWGIALVLGIVCVGLVLAMGVVGDWYNVPVIFGGAASVIFYWITTGLDGWAPKATLSAGSVTLSVFVSLVCGTLLGLASVRLSSLVKTS
jgi:hypothetical protein